MYLFIALVNRLINYIQLKFALNHLYTMYLYTPACQIVQDTWEQYTAGYLSKGIWLMCYADLFSKWDYMLFYI